jgi:hypothetical protein
MEFAENIGDLKMVGYTVTQVTGSKFGVRFERIKGFLLGIQASLTRTGGVRLSLCGWSLWIGMIPVRKVKRGQVVNGDPLDEILAGKGKTASFEIEYRLPEKSNGKA